MFPVRCYTCNTTLAQLHPLYRAKLCRGGRAGPIMDGLGIGRMCCRRMMLGHVDVTSDQLHFGNTNIVLDKGSVVIERAVEGERVVSCD
jgi:DNA-directed RNA polymerase subunit N (RpoN/RPB10)